MMRIRTNFNLLITIFAAALFLSSCGHPSVPRNAVAVDKLPVIFPDYTEVTIPSNLCPINFMVREVSEEMVTRLSAAGVSYTYAKGKQVIIDEDEWHSLLAAARSSVSDGEMGNIKVEVFVRQLGDWYALRPFDVHVAPEEIDPYISYRLIPPSYVSYEELIIEQRNLTSFETQEIYNNRRMLTEQKGHCINCHSYQNYHTDNMLFHVRQDHGGTVIVHNGKVKKVNLKTPNTLSAGVYPAWHPTESMIAFSTNLTAQMFHTVDTAKIEVFDGASDLILYDIETDLVTDIAKTDSLLECFPTWSPDGRYLYFTCARTPYDPASPDVKAEAMAHYADIRYDLCRKPFNMETRTFGPTEMVYEASADSLSVTLPRLSPDGRFIAMSRAPYGCFHVWHPTADIVVVDLNDSTPVPQPVDGLNSGSSDSYPSFSSNGRWLMTSSRRDDGSYTRPYISYFDAEGHCHKAFEVPQESPTFYTLSFKSFNRPEFMLEPVKLSVDDFEKVIKCDPIQAK